MNEQFWSERWARNILHLYDLVWKKNKNLIDSGSNARIIPQFIDAINLSQITDLSQKHDHIFLVTEQTFSAPVENVTVIPVSCTFYGAYVYDYTDTAHLIKKDFNCFINRNDPIRQTWFYLLFARQLLDNGFVSFNLSMKEALDYPVDSESDYFDYIHQSYLSSFDPIKSDIKKLVPYKNFKDTGDLSSIIMSSKFSIIVETYFERTDCQVFSEKTFRALHFPRPWLLFAATGCVQRLRNLGFDVFDDYVDHGYDNYDTSSNCVNRQEAMLEQCAKLQGLKVTEDILRDWQKKAAHNREMLKKWNQTYISDLESLLEKVYHTAKSL